MTATIARLPKNAREEIRVELCEFKGHQLLGLRVWTTDTERPTQKGLTVSVGMIPDIRAALADAEERARALGLLPGNKRAGNAGQSQR